MREYGVDSPTDGVELAPNIWANVTEKWLSLRTPTSDETRARWPVAPEWAAIQQAALRCGAIGIDRVRAGRRRGELRRTVPTLVGYLAKTGMLVGTDDIVSTLAAVGQLLRDDEVKRQVRFDDRIATLVREESFR